jgi:hypothetical protein
MHYNNMIYHISTAGIYFLHRIYVFFYVPMWFKKQNRFSCYYKQKNLCCK